MHSKMHKKLFYVGNWKLYFSFHEALNFVSNYEKALSSLTTVKESIIILAPSTEALFPIKQLIKETPLFLAAQSCAPIERGAATGQTSAANLQEIGCDYVLIGHSEQRKIIKNNNEQVAQQVRCALDAGLVPLICVGEDAKGYADGHYLEQLTEQLTPIINIVTLSSRRQSPLMICYEPTWAIGSNASASPEHIETVFFWLKNLLEKEKLFDQATFLYGGAVSSENVATLKKIKLLGGFLLGRASLNFQEFEKIVHYE